MQLIILNLKLRQQGWERMLRLNIRVPFQETKWDTKSFYDAWWTGTVKSSTTGSGKPKNVYSMLSISSGDERGPFSVLYLMLNTKCRGEIPKQKIFKKSPSGYQESSSSRV